MIKDNIIAKTITKIISPVIIFYGIYILLNGEDSPGGGFQAGAIFATYFILLDILGFIKDSRIDKDKILLYSSLGVLLYLLVGFIPIFLGSNFLDYDALMIDPMGGQHIGIFLIEIGITITVSCVLSFLYLSFKSEE
jgi:multicomponent Na+:H+ antiporter subunit B